LEVRDNGRGMPEDFVKEPQSFYHDPYYQAGGIGSFPSRYGARSVAVELR